jgi:hypothetical protein
MLLRPGVDVPWGRWPTLAAQLLLTVVITELSYRWIEQPIRRQGFKSWASMIAEPLRRRSPQAAVLWPVVAAVFLLGLTIGLIEGSATPAPAGEPVALADEPSIAEIEILGDPAAADSASPPPSPSTTAPAPARNETQGSGGVATTTTQPSPAQVDPAEGNSQTAAVQVEAPTPGPLMIGDSVMLGAEPSLILAIEDARVEAEVSRQMKQVPDVVEAMRAEAPLGEVAVIHLGTNGVFSPYHFDAVMFALEDVDRVHFVNTRVPRRWEENVNKALAEGVELWPNAFLIDWNTAAADHPEYFRKDGVHLTGAGTEAYARLIAQSIQR